MLLLLLSHSVMSNAVRPHRQQPTRLPCPWDSPGKNTKVGCHFLLQCMKVKSEREVTQPCSTLSNPMDCSLPGSSIHGIFQARVLEWGAIAFSSSKHERDSNHLCSMEMRAGIRTKECGQSGDAGNSPLLTASKERGTSV